MIDSSVLLTLGIGNSVIELSSVFGHMFDNFGRVIRPLLPFIQHEGRKMSENTPVDRRIRKTEAALWQALFGLLQSHDWDQINVQMICKAADVSRSTFYTHYPTKQDLLDAGFALGAAEFTAQIMAIPPDHSRLPTLDWLLDHVVASSGFMRRIAGSSASHAIWSRFRATTTDQLRKDLVRKSVTASDAEMTFIAGGIFACIEAWVATGCKQPQAKLAQALNDQIRRVLSPPTTRPDQPTL
jgi:AcrR family transcriptional regulator